jgi:hypothetical protein
LRSAKRRKAKTAFFAATRRFLEHFTLEMLRKDLLANLAAGCAQAGFACLRLSKLQPLACEAGLAMLSLSVSRLRRATASARMKTATI